MTPFDANKLIRLATVAAAGLAVYFVVSGIIIHQTTRLVSVRSSDPNAIISVTQDERSAEKLGTGAAKARLKPGHYLVAASNSGKFVYVEISVNQHSQQVFLDMNRAKKLPTVYSINFVGADQLQDFGPSSDQISIMKHLFFRFKPTANTIILSGVKPVPHNRNSLSTSDSILFKVSIDKTAYNAKFDYSLLGNGANLFLYNSKNGAPVFNSLARTE